MGIESTRVGAALQNGASHAIEYHTRSVGGLNVFYREAGPAACTCRVVVTWVSHFLADV